MTDEESCSDCKLETIERSWTEILLHWLSNCVDSEDAQINIKNLQEILNKYKDDISNDNFDRALLDSDLDTFFRNKFPILRLGSIEDDKETFYVLISALLYYCCTNTKGEVSYDICHNLSKTEQILIVKFCEIMSTMEVTMYNIKNAIEGAYASIKTFEDTNNTEITETEWSDSEMTESEKFNSLVKLKKNTNPATIKFKSSITVLPSVVNDTSRSLDYSDDCSSNAYMLKNHDDFYLKSKDILEDNAKGIKESTSNPLCQDDCACTRCSPSGPCCGHPKGSREMCDDSKMKKFKPTNHKWAFYTACIILTLALMIFLSTMHLWLKNNPGTENTLVKIERRNERSEEMLYWTWQCQNKLCYKVLSSSFNTSSSYNSMSECTLLCTGPQLWPLPVGKISFSETIVYLSTKKMEYKFNSIPSEEVRQQLAEAFKLFIKDLAQLEKYNPNFQKRPNLTVKKMIIQIDIESDTDPRLRLTTDESYTLKIKSTNNSLYINITSVSFCGSRHGLETLSQLFLPDQSTGFLIILSDLLITDSPTYKYRGLMIDSVANVISTIDIVRTLDAMSYSKLNTFHWRIGITSFPIEHSVFQHGPCDKSFLYTKEDIAFVAKWAEVRGIRVLIEVTASNRFGSQWNWLTESSCPKNNDRSKNLISIQDIFNCLQNVYTLILELTKVDDVFHLGQNIFHMLSCYEISDSDYFEKALQHLKLANKGFLPRLPIIWYNANFLYNFDTWLRFGVQSDSMAYTSLSKFKVIVSMKWDLSCDMKMTRCIKYRSWQQMYSWMSWRNIEAFKIEGGEATLWTNFIDSSNLDYHLWPRAATVAERLWSDVVASSKPDKFVYARLDAHRSRMIRRGISVAPIWPTWCSAYPAVCLQNLQ